MKTKDPNISDNISRNRFVTNGLDHIAEDKKELLDSLNSLNEESTDLEIQQILQAVMDEVYKGNDFGLDSDGNPIEGYRAPLVTLYESDSNDKGVHDKNNTDVTNEVYVNINEVRKMLTGDKKDVKGTVGLILHEVAHINQTPKGYNEETFAGGMETQVGKRFNPSEDTLSEEGMDNLQDTLSKENEMLGREFKTVTQGTEEVKNIEKGDREEFLGPLIDFVFTPEQLGGVEKIKVKNLDGVVTEAWVTPEEKKGYVELIEAGLLLPVEGVDYTVVDEGNYVSNLVIGGIIGAVSGKVINKLYIKPLKEAMGMIGKEAVEEVAESVGKQSLKGVTKEVTGEFSETIGNKTNTGLEITSPKSEKLKLNLQLFGKEATEEVSEKVTKKTGESLGANGQIEITGASEVLEKGKKVFKEFNTNKAYIKPKHLSTSGGKSRKFLGNSKKEAESILREAMQNGKIVDVIDNGLTTQNNQSYEIILDAGKQIGTKGENLIKIILSDDGGILTAYPVK